jgi:hypothetical protein
MASTHTGPARIGLPLVSVLLAVVLLAGCGGSSGVHTQTPTSDSPTASTSVTSGSPGTSMPSTASSAPTSPVPSITTPSVIPTAQDAVNAYIALSQATVVADRDPARADLTAINKYLTGKALTLIDGQYAAMRKTGQAYRGTPANPRVKVGTVVGSTLVFLSSCPLASKADPYTEYYVKTGQPVPVAKRTPPPPYLLTLTMKKVGDQWKLSDVLQNAGKTCTG